MYIYIYIYIYIYKGGREGSSKEPVSYIHNRKKCVVGKGAVAFELPTTTVILLRE